ncbi:MAG: guanylate kinase [Candidatus Aminicenantia bacterium]
MRSLVFILTGPSGVGKSTIIKLLMNSLPDIHFSVSHTTRPPRPNEENGVDYHFINPAEFESMIKKEKFIEWAEVHGYLYGTSFYEIEKAISKGKDLILDVDIQGASSIKRKFTDAVTIFLLPPSWEVLKERLSYRETDNETIEKRLKRAKEELKEWKNFDYIVVNDNLKKAVTELSSIILAERAKRKRREEIVKEILSEIDE